MPPRKGAKTHIQMRKQKKTPATEETEQHKADHQTKLINNPPNPEAIFLGRPEKSQHDPNTYSIIRLRNGMTILLISHPHLSLVPMKPTATNVKATETSDEDNENQAGIDPGSSKAGPSKKDSSSQPEKTSPTSKQKNKKKKKKGQKNPNEPDSSDTKLERVVKNESEKSEKNPESNVNGELTKKNDLSKKGSKNVSRNPSKDAQLPKNIDEELKEKSDKVETKSAKTQENEPEPSVDLKLRIFDENIPITDEIQQSIKKKWKNVTCQLVSEMIDEYKNKAKLKQYKVLQSDNEIEKPKHLLKENNDESVPGTSENKKPEENTTQLYDELSKTVVAVESSSVKKKVSKQEKAKAKSNAEVMSINVRPRVKVSQNYCCLHRIDDIDDYEEEIEEEEEVCCNGILCNFSCGGKPLCGFPYPDEPTNVKDDDESRFGEYCCVHKAEGEEMKGKQDKSEEIHKINKWKAKRQLKCCKGELCNNMCCGRASCELKRIEPYYKQWYARLRQEQWMFDSKATVKLCINVGNFSDVIACTSNLLTNSILQSSFQFPTTDDLSRCVQLSGGWSTTILKPEKTTFALHVPESCIPAIIDRFSACFIRAKLLPMTVLSERYEVESEHYGKPDQSENTDNKNYILSAIAALNEKHPGSRLGPGYEEGMCQVGDTELYREVLNYHKRHYTANRMALVFEGRCAIKYLEEYAQICFSEVPTSDLPPIDFSQYYNFEQCWDIDDFRMVYETRGYSKDGFSKIEFNWSTPPIYRNYKTKPHQFIAMLLKNEGNGSLISYLRWKRWAVRIDCGPGTTEMEPNTIYSLFNLSITVTELGMLNQKEIMDAVFSYLNLLRRECPMKELYEEAAEIERIKFDNKPYQGPWSLPYGMLCEGMHHYTPEEYITGPILFFKYNGGLITSFMRFLSPRDVCIMILDENYTNASIDISLDKRTTLGEIYFDNRYCSRHPIPPRWTAKWKHIAPYPQFYLPGPNPFFGKDFKLIPPQSNVPKPDLTSMRTYSRIWHKVNEICKTPETWINFLYLNPAGAESAKSSVTLELYGRILSRMVLEPIYPAFVMGYGVEIKSFYRGLIVRVHGFSQHTPSLMTVVTKFIKNFPILVRRKTFEDMKISQLQKYRGYINDDHHFINNIFQTLITPRHWMYADLYAELDQLQFEEFVEFTKLFIKKMYIYSLLQGNITAWKALKYMEETFEILGTEPLDWRQILPISICKIPTGIRCCKIENYYLESRSIIVKNYYQCVDQSSLEMKIAIDILIVRKITQMLEGKESGQNCWVFFNEYFCELASIMNKHMHKELRCCVSPYQYRAIKDLDTINAYSIERLVEVDVGDGVESEEIDVQIELYRERLNETLSKLSTKYLWEIKNTHICQLTRKPASLQDDVNIFWKEMLMDEPFLDRRMYELVILYEMPTENLKQNLLFLTGKNNPGLSKLSMQLVPRMMVNSQLMEVKKPPLLIKPNGPWNAKSHFNLLSYLTAADEEIGRDSSYYITDIASFKRSLPSFPTNPQLPRQ